MKYLSFHYTPTHRHQFYLDAIASAQPQVMLLLDASKNDYMEVRRRVPQCRIILRSYEWSDGGMDVLSRAQHDPIGTGRWMADNWIQRMKEWGVGIDKDLTYFTGVNEYTVVPGVPIAPFVLCEAEFARRLGAAGLRPCIGNEGVGHPAHVNSEGKVDWSQYAAWERILQDTQGVLGLHEYWRAEFGPRMNVKPQDEVRNRFWYAWRFQQCPFDVPIAVTEWGVDQKVDAPAGTPSEGWLGNLTPAQYAQQLREYIDKAIEDRRFVGATIFTHDYASDEWAGYDTARALNDIVQTAKSLPEATWYTPGSVRPPVVVPPDVTAPPDKPSTPSQRHAYRLPLDTLNVTQWWSRTHGGIDYSCSVGTPVKASADGVVAMVADDRESSAKDGGYGLYVRIWHESLRIHTFYAHLSRQDVRQGDSVKYGQTIGVSGNTGNSTGPHLHYEVRLGTSLHTYDKAAAGETYNARIDPMAWKAGHEVA